MEKKMTKVQKYALALSLSEVQAIPVLVEFFNAEIELLKKKNASASSKPTATQTANEEIKADILAAVADGEKRTVTEIMKIVAKLEGASNQKATALVRQLADEDDPNAPMERIVEKGKAYFRIKQGN